MYGKYFRNKFTRVFEISYIKISIILRSRGRQMLKVIYSVETVVRLLTDIAKSI